MNLVTSGVRQIEKTCTALEMLLSMNECRRLNRITPGNNLLGDGVCFHRCDHILIFRGLSLTCNDFFSSTCYQLVDNFKTHLLEWQDFLVSCFQLHAKQHVVSLIHWGPAFSDGTDFYGQAISDVASTKGLKITKGAILRLVPWSTQQLHPFCEVFTHKTYW